MVDPPKPFQIGLVGGFNPNEKYQSIVHTRREALSLAARSHADHRHRRNKTRIGAMTKREKTE